jgi:hypothetical protein
MPTPPTTARHSDWRSTHLGRLLGEAVRRFDARVLVLMTDDVLVPLALSNLAARQQVGAAHIHITRHLPLDGARLMDLAHAANMSKQAMGDLVDQCEAWNVVRRVPHPHDKRASSYSSRQTVWLGLVPSSVQWRKPSTNFRQM